MRQASVERLGTSVAQLEDDAVELLAYIAERLVVGRRLYGALDLAIDKRDWMSEALAEDADGIAYRAAAAVIALRKTKTRRRSSRFGKK